MALQDGFQFDVSHTTKTVSVVSLRVQLYQRSLEPTLVAFVTQENLCIDEVFRDENFIEYDIWCCLDQISAIRRLEYLLENATHLLDEAARVSSETPKFEMPNYKSPTAEDLEKILEVSLP